MEAAFLYSIPDLFALYLMDLKYFSQILLFGNKK